MKTIMKTSLKTTARSLILLAALGSLAQAQTAGTPPAATAGESKTLDTKSPWSVETSDKNDGLLGSQSTTVKRDMGDGWSVGGKMTTPYEDPKIGGSGAPGLKQYESPGNNTVIGPVLEKKF